MDVGGWKGGAGVMWGSLNMGANMPYTPEHCMLLPHVSETSLSLKSVLSL